MPTGETVTPSQIADLVGVSLRTVRRRLPQLQLAGKIKPVIEGSGQRPSQYSIDEVLAVWKQVSKWSHRIDEIVSEQQRRELSKIAKRHSTSKLQSWLQIRGYAISRSAVHRWVEGGE